MSTVTRGRPIAGAPRLRSITAAALCTLFGAVLLPNLFRLLLPLPDWLYEVLLLAYLGGGLLVVLAVAGMAWVALWPATPYLTLAPGEPEPQGADPREAKAALLAFPSRVAMAGVAAGELLTASGWLALVLAGLPGALVLSLSLTTAVMVALLWLLLHALAQRAVEPLLSRLREVPLSGPSESGSGISARLSSMLLLVVLAGVVPVAIFSNAYVERIQDGQEAAHAERCAAWLSVATRGLSPEAAQRVVDTVELSQGQPTLAAQEALQPRPRSLQAPARPPAVLWGRSLSMSTSYVEAERPALLVLPGGKRLYLPRHDSREALDSRPAGLALAILGLLGLAGLLAFLLARAVAGDVRGLVRRLQALCALRPSEVTSARARSQVLAGRDAAVRFHETEQLSEALERLLDRVRRLHVESYLSIERNMDARRAKSQFLASMSHDLRGPLTSVLGFSELLTGGFEGEIPEAARRRLLHVHKTGRRLLRLLSEILDTAKVESQTIELHPRRCAAAELLMQAVAEARRGRLQEDIPLVIDVPTGLPAVSVDPLRFPQALAHLINHVLDSIAPEPALPPAPPLSAAPTPPVIKAPPLSSTAPYAAPSSASSASSASAATPRSPSGTLRVLADRAPATRPRIKAGATLAPSSQSPAPPSPSDGHAAASGLGIVRISAREGERQVTLPARGAVSDTDSGVFFARLRRGLMATGVDSGLFPSMPSAPISDNDPQKSSPQLAAVTHQTHPTGPSAPVITTIPTLEVLIEHVVGHVTELEGREGREAAAPAAPDVAGAAGTVGVPHVARHSLPGVPASTILLGAVGLGLALPLARRLIALHGGTIEVITGASIGLRAVIPLRPATLLQHPTGTPHGE